MEQLNRIEIQGLVGSVNILLIGDSRMARFSVATNSAYKSRGDIVVETTWHEVVAWEGQKGIPTLDIIAKGKPIHVVGRLRRQKYVGSDNVERSTFQILASSVSEVSE